MLATIALSALLASTPSDALDRLEVAGPSDAASAVASCLRAITPGAVDESRLLADGWRPQSGVGTNLRLFARQGNAAILFTMDGPHSDLCTARVRLADAASIDETGVQIDRLLGVESKRRPNKPGYFFWRKGRTIVGAERFDDGPGSTPYVIQIAVGESPRELR